jgi:predicted DNA binding protein
LINDSGFFKNIPKHWGVSKKHEDDITRFIDIYYKEIEKFKQDPILIQLLQDVNIKLKDLYMFVDNIPLFTDIVKETIDQDSKETTTVLHSLFDKHTIYLLYTYCFYSSIYEYILASEEVGLLRSDVQETKQKRRSSIKETKNLSNSLRTIGELNADADDLDEDLREVNIVTADLTDLQQRTCSLLIAFLNIEKTNKTKVDFSYEQIMQKVGRSKEKEKQNIIKYLGDMSIEERGVENMFKNYRLGRWNVGQQTGLIRYDKETYDRERDELITQLYNETEGGTLDTHEELLDVYQLEELEKNAPDDEMGFGLDDVGENFMDGEYYEEDRDDFAND